MDVRAAADWQADVCRESATDSWTPLCSWGHVEARDQLSNLLCSCCALNVSLAALSLACVDCCSES